MRTLYSFGAVVGLGVAAATLAPSARAGDWSVGTVWTAVEAIDLCPNACLMTARFTLASTSVTPRECLRPLIFRQSCLLGCVREDSIEL